MREKSLEMTSPYMHSANSVTSLPKSLPNDLEMRGRFRTENLNPSEKERFFKHQAKLNAAIIDNAIKGESGQPSSLNSSVKTPGFNIERIVYRKDLDAELAALKSMRDSTSSNAAPVNVSVTAS